MNKHKISVSLLCTMSAFSALKALDVFDADTVTTSDFTYLSEVSFKGTQTDPVTAVLAITKNTTLKTVDDGGGMGPPDPIIPPDFIILSGNAGKIAVADTFTLTLNHGLRLNGGGQLDLQGNFVVKYPSMVGSTGAGFEIIGGSKVNVLANSKITSQVSLVIGTQNDSGTLAVDASSRLVFEDFIYDGNARVEICGSAADMDAAIFTANWFGSLYSSPSLTIDISALDLGSASDPELMLFESSEYTITQSFIQGISLVYKGEALDLSLSEDGRSVSFTAIPEASAYSPGFGVIAIVAAVLRRRR